MGKAPGVNPGGDNHGFTQHSHHGTVIGEILIRNL